MNIVSEKFWLVWSPSGKFPPAFQHGSEENAEKEAERLAIENPDQIFIVMESVTAKTVKKVTSVDFIEFPDQIPF